MYAAMLSVPTAATYDVAHAARCASPAAPRCRSRCCAASRTPSAASSWRATACPRPRRSPRSTSPTASASPARSAPRSQGVEMQLVDDDGKDVAAGEVGEIAIRGQNVMKGYWGSEEATAEAIPDGWFRTGDLARQDEDGYFFIVDRKKDLIIRGGYNVYPREVEEVLYEHPAVAEAAVVGIPHPTLGEEVGAAVVLKAGCRGHAGGAAGLRQGAARGLQVPAARVDRGGDAAQGADRQDPAPRGRSPPEGLAPMSGQPTDRRARRAAGPAARRGRARAAPPVPARARPGSGSPPAWPAGRDRLAPAGGRPGRRARPGRRRPLRPWHPHEKDRRFADAAWTHNPLLRRLSGLPGRRGDRRGGWWTTPSSTGATASGCGFIVDNLVEALAPSNNPLAQPGALAGPDRHRRRQPRRAAAATWSATSPPPPRVPSMVEPDAFEVGTDLAVTPGAVVLRTDVFELIQYTPQTPKVRSVPLLIVPPTINKYYVIDLAEQRSLVEHLVAQRPAGLLHLLAQPRRPARRLGRSTPTARRSSRRWTRPGGSAGQDQVALLGHLLRRDARRRWCWPTSPPPATSTGSPAFSLAVTVLDQDQAGLPSALLSHKAAAAATAAPRRRRATSTAGRWPRCSPGCGPTT